MPGENGVSWTYETLHDISVRHTTRLQAMNVGAGDRVAMLLSRRPESIALMLAILRLGAMYVPIDPASPAQRLTLMLEDSQPALLLTDAHTLPWQQELAVQRDIPIWNIDTDPREERSNETLITEDTVPQLSEQLSEQTLMRMGNSARHGAYVMYTSGSTGTPKGVVIPHRAIVRLVYRQYYAPLNARLVMLHAAPLAFDASTLEIWGPLLNGGTCVIHPQAIPTGTGLATTIRDEGVNAAWLTAALFNRVVDENPLHLQGLRTLMTGGEALSPRHVRKTLQALPGLQLINGYGPTETTTFAVTGPVSEHDLATHSSVPLGRPINWTYVRVLTPAGEPVPPGLTGELYIGGPRPCPGLPEPPGPDPRALRARPRSVRRTTCSTAPAMPCAGWTMAGSSIWAGWTGSSRSAVSGSNRARSRPCCPDIRPWPAPPSRTRRPPMASAVWWPGWWRQRARRCPMTMRCAITAAPACPST